jgi:phospholipid/cholesterol/gamma-HCH transport system substrate-binding protein
VTASRSRGTGLIIIAFAVFCVGVLEFLALNMGQASFVGSSYTIHAIFSDADGLPTNSDVRAIGVDVGKVVSISHDPAYPGETVATLQITDASASPVYTNGYANVRPKTLLGEKYVDLTVGGGAAVERIADGGFLPVAQTGKDVSNDEIFNAFDATARQQQQQVFKELDAATFQRSPDIQAILPQLTKVVSSLAPLAKVYEKDQPQVDDIFVQFNTFMQTVADEHEQLAGLLKNGNVALGAIAQRDQALITTLQKAADFSTEINNAVAPTIAAQRQAIQALAPALDAQNRLLNQIVAPQSSCGNRPCGIDQLFLGTLTGNINYPNNQVTVTYNSGELVALEWDSMFSQPVAACPDPESLPGGAVVTGCDAHRALGFVFSPHGGVGP